MEVMAGGGGLGHDVARIWSVLVSRNLGFMMLPAKLDSASVAAEAWGLVVTRKEDAAMSTAGGPACTLPGGRGPVPTIVEDLVRGFDGLEADSGAILHHEHSLRVRFMSFYGTY